MRRVSFDQSPCPIARSLDAVGEWWSLLIVRDALAGIRRFGDFQKSLGLAKNILSARLKRLVEVGVMEMVPGSNGRLYHEYALTPKGEGLLPVIVALRQWGESSCLAKDERRMGLLERKTGRPVALLQVCSQDGRPLQIGDLAFGEPVNDVAPD